MPCYRCGTRQSDPDRGPSPWRRGVVAEHLVLVCPACQRQAGWAEALTACGRCGSRHLIRRLDQVECLDCRMTRDAAPDAVLPAPQPLRADVPAADSAPPDTAPSDTAPASTAPASMALADEVARALDRVLRRE